MVDQKKWIQYGLVVLSTLILLSVVGVLFAFVYPSASNQGYTPEQPIPFSHKVHAGTNQIACVYCHSGAERSRHAGIPAVKVCMNCHSVVKLDSPHIQKLIKHYSENKPVEWVRVYESPDFVFFPHKRHVAQGISCETCHGNVKEMDKITQVSSLTMGWCLDCHRGVTTPKHVLAKTYPKMKPPAGHVADVSCTACHQ